MYKEKSQKEMVELMFGNFKYDNIACFSNVNYTVATLSGKAGLIDLKGNPITDFIYDDLTQENIDDSEIDKMIDYFHFVNSNYYSLRLNNKWGVLNNKGETIVDFIYDERIEICSQDFFIVRKDKYGVINSNKKIILDCIYENIQECSLDNDSKIFFIATLNDKQALFNSEGERLC